MKTNLNDTLDEILDKASRLVEICEVLKEENELLTIENQNVKNNLMQLKTKNIDLEKKLDMIKMAKSIESTNEKSVDIKQKINEFVQEIDKCMLLLKNN